MKKYFILWLKVMGVVATSALAWSAAQPSLTELVETRKLYSIHSYPIKLRCTYSDHVDSQGDIFITAEERKGNLSCMGTIKFDIDNTTHGKIGEIELQWYPRCTPYSISPQKNNILRICHIGIGEDCASEAPHPLQKHGFGTMAMEILFTIFRESPHFPEETALCLECQLLKPYLSRWYRKFGFTDCPTPPRLLELEVQYMTVPLVRTQFPLRERHASS